MPCRQSLRGEFYWGEERERREREREKRGQREEEKEEEVGRVQPFKETGYCLP